jgi:hypothetical protein
MSRIRVMGLAVTMLLAPQLASATDTTSVPYTGITYIKRVLSNQRIHILKINLSLKTLRVHATKPPGGMRTSIFAANNGCVVAVNGDFGTRQAPWQTTGLAMGGGVVWTNTKDTSLEGFTAFGRDNQAQISPPAAVMVKPDPWMAEIVGGRPMIVDKGVARDPVAPYSSQGCGPHFCYKEPRTAYGLSKDGKTFIVAVVEGRKPPVAVGMTTKELGVLMAGLGAWTALNEDGGGSSTVYIKKLGGVVSDADPNEGERTVSNHLGFAVVSPFGTLKGFVRDSAPNDPKAGIVGAKVTLSTGASTITGASGVFQLTNIPSGQVTVTAAMPGFLSSQKTVTIFSADTVSTVLVLARPGADAAVPDQDAGAGEWSDAAVNPEGGIPDEKDAGAWVSADEGPADGGPENPAQGGGGCGCALAEAGVGGGVWVAAVAVALVALLSWARRRRPVIVDRR